MPQEITIDWAKLDFEHARAKHLLFKARLRSLLYGIATDEAPVVSHLECTVGKWIYSRGLTTYSHIPEMHQLEQWHKDLHVEAKRLVTLYKEGQVEKARNELPRVERIAEQVHYFLDAIEMKVQGNNLTTTSPEGVSEVLNINLEELQELLRLNEHLDQRINEKTQILYEANERFELVSKATQDAIWDWNLVTNEIWWNEGFKELFGYSDMEIEPTVDSWYTRLHPDDKDWVIGSIHRVIDCGERNWSAEYRFRKKNGDYAIVLDRGYAVHDTNGKPYRMLGSMLDITERKRAEEALKLSEERLQKVVSIETVGVIYFDMDGVIHDANYAFEKMSGYSLETIKNVGIRWDKVTPPEFMDVTLKSREEFLTRWQNTPYEKQYIRPDGSRFWGLFAGKRLSERECVEFVVDITKAKQAEEELERKVQERTLDLENANEDLRRSNQNLEEFAYAASHDLKEPIRKIHFFSDRLKNRLSNKLEAEDLRYFDRMEQSSHRMSTLIDDLLLYSHVSRSTSLEEMVDLNRKVQLVLEDLELSIEEKGAHIEVGSLPVLRGHKRQLQQLFQNLISNALKYTQPGVSPVITITCQKVKGSKVPLTLNTEERNSDFYQISLKDNGIGFEQANAERIFNVFTRLHGMAEYKGSGIGLSIVRKVAENHGGLVWAESQANKGAIFNVLLPVNSPYTI
jgi:two-component system CheB/CheR fusion protein